VPWLELEWDGFCALVDEGWHGEFEASARAAWRLLLDRHEPAKVITALEQLVARGLKHRPSVSEIVAAIGTDPSRPSFAEAIQLIYGPGGVLHARPADRTWRDERERRRAPACSASSLTSPAASTTARPPRSPPARPPSKAFTASTRSPPSE
jgi:hypothetical protein